MKINRKILVPIVLGTALIGTLILGSTVASQKETLSLQEQRISELEQRLEAQNALQDADKMLAEGKYQNALRSYQEQQKNPIHDGELGLSLRMAIAQKFLTYENDIAQQQRENSQLLDSVAVETAPSQPTVEVSVLDSLNFALSKTKMQLAKLRKQMHTKSFGEYLTFTNSKGSQVHYVGQVKNGKAHGYGVAILNTGSRYVGEWQNNQRHGQGTFYWKDGEYYEGSYVADKRNGQGSYFWPNGEKYVGQWKDDRRSGKGAFFGKDGKIMTSGVWEDDKMVTSENRPRKNRSKEKTVATL